MTLNSLVVQYSGHYKPTVHKEHLELLLLLIAAGARVYFLDIARGMILYGALHDTWVVRLYTDCLESSARAAVSTSTGTSSSCEHATVSTMSSVSGVSSASFSWYPAPSSRCVRPTPVSSAELTTTRCVMLE